MALVGAGWEHFREPDENAVGRRLDELGIPLGVLREALQVGHARGDFTTAAHPRTYQGTVVWAELTGQVRLGLARLGWTFDDTDNIARSVSPDGTVTVIAVRGNEFTGVRSRHEQLSTRRPRGSAGARIVRVNAQIELEFRERTTRREEPTADLAGTWFLLYNRVGEIVRSELSFAAGVDESGKLHLWTERLILPDIDLLGNASPDAQVGDGIREVDVPVSRRVN